MKRVLLTVAVCMVASASFAQKKADNEALRIAQGQTPDFAEAKVLLQGALVNPDTQGYATTWFDACQIEDLQ